jgi:hypothetical protein
LRSFGLIVASGFAVVGLWPAIVRGQDLRKWAITLSIVVAVAALVFPRSLKSFHRIWMGIGEKLGWVNSRIMLGLLYYIVIVPLGVIRRSIGKDPMQRKLQPDLESYKISRTRRPPSHMQRQY